MKTLTILSVSILLLLLHYSCDNNKIPNPQSPTVESPVPISYKIPVDVNPALQKKLNAKGDNFYDLNVEFNKFSWQAFIAIFWPMDVAGKPMPNFTDQGQSEWLSWKESFQVYRADGGVPPPWGSPRTGGALPHDTSLVSQEDFRIYLTAQTPTHKGLSKNIADEVDQAFAGRLFDQKGNTVVYEILMNEAEFSYLKDNKLYNINGQINFTRTGQIANFPKGNYEKDTVGAIEIKLAWKILTDSDYKERYYQSQGYIIDEETQDLVQEDLGLIGFHISQKTPTGKQWVWSTFEHIDNIDQNTIEKNGNKVPIHPTLYDPNCEICPVNVDLYNPPNAYVFNQGPHGNLWVEGQDTVYANSNVMKTQSKRMIDIPVRVQQLNKKMQDYLKSKGSVFQYYQLIDTQYPTDQEALPGNHTEEGYQLPASVVNKSGGNPNLTYLTNITMETFFQGGNQPASAFMEANPASNIQVFGTEGCMGCHSSAGIYTLDSKAKLTKLPQLSGDFSWLLTKKAQWDKSKPIPTD
ncbi:MAG: hypothetical protein JKY03_03085 [Aureispira sp.]|nr:hypothetical protein [Aureispira sp.]